MKVNASKYPTLARLLTNGTLYVDDIAICGMASDGASVVVGDTHNLRSTEAYLVSHPTSRDW